MELCLRVLGIKWREEIRMCIPQDEQTSNPRAALCGGGVELSFDHRQSLQLWATFTDENLLCFRDI